MAEYIFFCITTLLIIMSFLFIFKIMQEDKKEIKKQLDEMESWLFDDVNEIKRNTNFLSEMEQLKQNLRNLQNKIEERQQGNQ